MWVYYIYTQLINNFIMVQKKKLIVDNLYSNKYYIIINILYNYEYDIHEILQIKTKLMSSGLCLLCSIVEKTTTIMI